MHTCYLLSVKIGRVQLCCRYNACKTVSKVKTVMTNLQSMMTEEFCLPHARAEKSLSIFTIKLVERVVGSTVLTP